jgi:hypothetical protein
MTAAKRAIEVRWRAVDPGEASDGAGSTEYTRVHRTPLNDGVTHVDANRTLCGLRVPAIPYVLDEGAQVPSAAPRCTRCLRKRGYEL